MTIIVLELVFIFLLTITNGLFSMSELAIVSARKARLQQRAKLGSAGARVALELANEPNDFLSTVQIGITLIGILAGAVGGVHIAELIKGYVSGWPVIGQYGDAIGVGVVVLVITYLSLVIGELIPKRVALHSPETIAIFIARPMKLLSRITAPAVSFLSLSTNGLLRIFGMHEAKDDPVTEDEIRILVHQGALAGTLETAERELVERVFRLNDQRVVLLMTPRREVCWIDIDDSIDEIKKTITNCIYSRFPVGQGNLDRAIGFVHAKDLLDETLIDKTLDIKSALQSPFFIPETMPALKALEMFKKTRRHFALIVDEFGGVQGLITMHDILEAIVGDIPVQDIDEPQIVKREDGSLLLDGMSLFIK